MIPKTANRISDAKRAQIIEALKANPNAKAVARELDGVSASSVHNIAKAAKIDLGRSGPKKVSAEKQALILEALKTNPNASAIARQFGGMSYKTVTRLAEKANIKLGNKVRLAAEKAALKRQRRASRTNDETTDLVECSR
jgi:transposase-like protein